MVQMTNARPFIMLHMLHAGARFSSHAFGDGLGSMCVKDFKGWSGQNLEI